MRNVNSSCSNCQYLMTLESIEDNQDIKYICTANPMPVEKEYELLKDYVCQFYSFRSALIENRGSNG